MRASQAITAACAPGNGCRREGTRVSQDNDRKRCRSALRTAQREGRAWKTSERSTMCTAPRLVSSAQRSSAGASACVRACQGPKPAHARALRRCSRTRLARGRVGERVVQREADAALRAARRQRGQHCASERVPLRVRVRRRPQHQPHGAPACAGATSAWGASASACAAKRRGAYRLRGRGSARAARRGAAPAAWAAPPAAPRSAAPPPRRPRPAAGQRARTRVSTRIRTKKSHAACTRQPAHVPA
jgi:hypothetical protein